MKKYHQIEIHHFIAIHRQQTIVYTSGRKFDRYQDSHPVRSEQGYLYRWEET